MSTHRLLLVALTAWFTALGTLSRIAAEDRKEYPPEARARYDQGQQFEQKSQWREAIAAYDDAIRLGMKDYPRAQLYRARAQLHLKEYDTAIAQYSRFIERFGLEDSCRY